jgi:D-lactate dehydrogenase
VVETVFDKMRIAVFEIEPHEASVFEGLAAKHQVRFSPEPLDAGNAAAFADAEAVSTFIYSTLDRAVLQRLPRLQLIATRSTGFDHIDTAYCAERGVTVSNVPIYGENTVAEHVFALLLTISHRMIEAVDRSRHGPFSPQGLQGFDLEGKTLGVVGTGSIGRHVIRIARGFGLDVVACDVRPDEATARQLGFRYVSLPAVLRVADIVTLHVPATPETRDLLSDEAFASMKDGVVVINTARGSLIDVPALIRALRRGKVAAAGLDVLPDEPEIREEAELLCSIFCTRNDASGVLPDLALLRMPNVVVTPHSAFNTREAMQRIVATTLANIAAFAEGHPQNVVALSPPGAPGPT